jgi:hypothetical protein
MRCRAPSYFTVLIFAYALVPIFVSAQGPGKPVRLPGFTIEPLSGNGWEIARPAEGFPGLLGYRMEKSPAWFSISSVEIPIPLISWTTTMRQEAVGLDQFVFTKRLHQERRLAATLVRASWTIIPFGDEKHFLEAIAQARERDLRKQPGHILEFKTQVEGDAILPGCLRIDARVEEAADSPQALIISTRRYICPHPDAPGYMVEVGYGQRTPEGEEPVSLEEETKPFLQSLKFVRQEDLIDYPVVRTTFVPVGSLPSLVALQDHTAWIAAGSNWLLQLDTGSGKTTGVVQFKRPVGDLVVGADAFWLPQNTIADKAPDTLSVEHLRFVDHLRHGAREYWDDGIQAGFAAGSIWLPACSASSSMRSMGCANNLARIDPKNRDSITYIKLSEPRQVAGNGDTVWVTGLMGPCSREPCRNGSLSRIDASSKVVSATVAVPATRGAKLLADSHAAWVEDGAAIWRVDAVTSEVRSLDFEGRVEACSTGSVLWVLEFANWRGADRNTVTSLRLHRFNAQTLQAVGEPISLGQSEESTGPISLSGIHLRACRDDEIWLSDSSGVLLRLDMRPQTQVP